MTLQAASMLRLGDLVRDTFRFGAPPRFGEVIRKRFAGLTVKWHTGGTERFSFSDLALPRYAAIFKQGYDGEHGRKT